MAGYFIISEVGNAIVSMLREGLVPGIIENAESIGLCEPDAKGDISLGIYLYEVRENLEVAEQKSRMKESGVKEQRYPSTFLTLYYMITAYSDGDVRFRSVQEQRILGKTVQILGDHPVIGRELLGEGQDSAYPIRISMTRIDNDEKVKMWNVPDLPYKLSLYYKVYPVEIESERTRKVSRVTDVSFTFREERSSK